MIDPLALLPPGALAYRPFLEPLAVWDYWIWLLLPLAFGISVVYKSVRVDSMRRLPLEAVRLTIWIVAAMAIAAAALLLLVRIMSR